MLLHNPDHYYNVLIQINTASDDQSGTSVLCSAAESKAVGLVEVKGHITNKIFKFNRYSVITTSWGSDSSRKNPAKVCTKLNDNSVFAFAGSWPCTSR